MIRIWRGYHSEALPGLIRDAWEREQLLVLCPPGLRDFGFVDLLPEGPLEAVGDWSDLPGSAEALASKKPGARAASYPDKPVLGVFTSGTLSGTPRLVLYSKRNLEFSLAGIRSFFDTRRFDTIFCYPQPFHTFGLVLGYVQAAVHGLRLVTGQGKYGRHFHRLRMELREESLLTLGTPTHFHDLLSFARTEGARPVPSYSCILGGAKVSVALWHQLRDELGISAPSIGYGATEASPGLTHQPPGLAPREEGEIGLPIPGIELRLESEAGLEFSGPNVCLAIIEDGAVQFPRSVFLRDRIRRREDGVLVFEGRLDLMLNRGGQKFSLERLEEVVSQASQAEAVCVSLPDERLGEELGVLLSAGTGRSHGSLEERQRRFEERKRSVGERLQREFGQAFQGASWKEVDAIPLNENSKVDRKLSARILSEPRVRSGQ